MSVMEQHKKVSAFKIPFISHKQSMHLNYETEEKNLQVGFKPRTLSNCSEKLFHLC